MKKNRYLKKQGPKKTGIKKTYLVTLAYLFKYIKQSGSIAVSVLTIPLIPICHIFHVQGLSATYRQFSRCKDGGAVALLFSMYR